MKKSATRGGQTVNYSLRCLKSLQKSVNELQRILETMSNLSDASQVVRHQSSLIACCVQNLLTALTSCNIYRVPFSEESYYLTQLSKIERSVNAVLDVVTSLSCRGFFAGLGKNEAQEDLFSALEHSFDAFVGPLLHIMNSFNVKCLLFQCDPLNLFLLDQVAVTPIKKRLCIFTQVNTYKPAPYDDSNDASGDDLKSTNDSSASETTPANRNRQGERRKSHSSSKPSVQTLDDVLKRYTSRSDVKLPLSELAVLIDHMSNGDVSRYKETFIENYGPMFEELISDKLAVIINRMKSFHTLNEAAKTVFYDSEIMALPSEEIVGLIDQSQPYALSDLKLTLLRSGYSPIPTTTTTSLMVAHPEESDFTNHTKGISMMSIERTSCPIGNSPSMQQQHHLQNSGYLSSSSVMKVGEVIQFCPHKHAIQRLHKEAITLDTCSCAFLRRKESLKEEESEDVVNENVTSQNDFPSPAAAATAATGQSSTSSGDSQEEGVVTRKELLFGRRAMNSVLTSDFSFSDHERMISRQQFSITYEGFSNEYNVQCLSQTNLTQFAIDELGFELSEGSIFILQDTIAFQVIACKGQTLRQAAAAAAAAAASQSVEREGDSLENIGFSITEIAQKLSRTLNKPLKSDGRNLNRILSNITDEQSFGEDDDSCAISSWNINENNSENNSEISNSKGPINNQQLKRGSSYNRISYRNSMLLSDLTPSSRKTQQQDDDGDNQSSSSENESSDEDNSDSGNERYKIQTAFSASTTEKVRGEFKRSSSYTQQASSSQQQTSLSHIASISDQPGALVKQRMSLNRQSNLNIVDVPNDSITAIVASNSSCSMNDVIEQTGEDEEEGECTMDYKRSSNLIHIDRSDPIISGGANSSSSSTITSPSKNLQLNGSFFANQMNVSSGSNSQTKPQLSQSHMRNSNYFISQSILDIEEERPKEDPFIQLRVLWSTVKTVKEDYFFIYDNTSHTIKEKKIETPSYQGGYFSQREEVELQQQQQQQQLQQQQQGHEYISIGSDSKSNQIHVDDKDKLIKDFAHCSICFSENTWTIMVHENDSKEHYAGVALKKAEEAENGLVSRKILLDNGYKLLVGGYIFACDF